MVQLSHFQKNTGNPLRCDCDSVWLWQWSQMRKGRPDGSELQLDLCVYPERWKGRHLTDLPADYCQSTDDIETTPQPEPDETDYIIRTVTMEAVPSPDGMNVTLGVSGNVSSISWTLSYRRFGSGQPLAPALTGTLSSNTTLTLVGLLSSTGYQVCVQLIGRAKNQEQHRCLEVTTLPEKKTSYPVTEVAVAASVSTSTTLVVVILVCCCCPGVKCGKKNKKLPKSSPDGSSSNTEVDQKNKIFSFSTGVEAESAVIWPSIEQFQPAHFSTFRGNTGGRKPRPTVPVDDQSHQVFQATCNYLRQRAMDPSRGVVNRNDGAQLMQLVQPRRPSINPLPVYLAAMPERPAPVIGGQRMVQQSSTVHYFNSSYGLTEFNPGQTDLSKYCTWRPSKKSRPLLSSWTSYPDFLANSGSFQHPLPASQPAIAVPVYSLTTSCRPRRKRDRFYWSAAPTPIHNVDLQF